MGEQQTENNLGYLTNKSIVQWSPLDSAFMEWTKTDRSNFNTYAMYLQMSLRKLAHKSGSKMSNREA